MLAICNPPFVILFKIYHPLKTLTIPQPTQLESIILASKYCSQDPALLSGKMDSFRLCRSTMTYKSLIAEVHNQQRTLTSIVEQDERTAYFYIWPTDLFRSQYAVRGCWLRNLVPAPA